MFNQIIYEFMEWTETIVANLATIAIALLGVVVAIVIYKKDKRHRCDSNTINKLANQVKAYYELEQLYIKDVATKNDASPLTTQKQYRSQIQDFKGKWISSNEAEKYMRP